MMLMRVLALVFLALAGWPAWAADEPAPTVPDPATLPGDWWTYYEPKTAIDDETLQKRVNAADKFLSDLAGKLGSAGRAQEAEDA